MEEEVGIESNDHQTYQVKTQNQLNDEECKLEYRASDSHIRSSHNAACGSFCEGIITAMLLELMMDMEQGEKSSVKVEGSDAPILNNSKFVSRVRKLLFRRMLVGVNDGRFFLGSFHCIDKQGNIILQDAVEYRNTCRSAPSPMEQRCLGLILIPSTCRTSCHVDCAVEEQLSLLSLKE
ncbi:LSM domain, eukaryotic/archaea-type [Dillenia turbinata]|uniref:LSM domain, eukaryotic/archaea-type n=1 Tax=Dillenia turbinata TaxID=194707 RepID=A0AAN8VQS9_9MAGN